jgi:hypothetical protein
MLPLPDTALPAQAGVDRGFRLSWVLLVASAIRVSLAELVDAEVRPPR